MLWTPIKELRLRNNFRQEDIEAITGIPQPRFSRIERGVTEPTPQELEKLKKAFGLIEQNEKGS